MPRSLSFKMSEKKSFHDSISILVCAHWRTLTIIITNLSPDAEQAEQQGLKSHSWPQLIFLFSITAWTLTFIQILLRKHLRSKDTFIRKGLVLALIVCLFFSFFCLASLTLPALPSLPLDCLGWQLSHLTCWSRGAFLSLPPLDISVTNVLSPVSQDLYVPFPDSWHCW